MIIEKCKLLKKLKIFRILVFTLIFYPLFSFTSLADEIKKYTSVTIDSVVQMINDTTFKQPVEAYFKRGKEEIDVIINVRDGGLRNSFKYNESNIINFAHEKELGNPSGGDGVNVWNYTNIKIDSLPGKNWQQVIEDHKKMYNTEAKPVTVANREAVLFEFTLQNDEYNGQIWDGTPTYSRKDEKQKIWLINLKELDNESEAIYITVFSHETVTSLAQGSAIEGWRKVHDENIKEFEEATKRIVSSINIQVNPSEIINNNEEDLSGTKEEVTEQLVDKDKFPIGPGTIAIIVVGTGALGIAIVKLTGLSNVKPSSIKTGPTGIKDGTERTLKGKTDGREYNIKYDAEKDEWVNTETGNPFDPDKFEKWQDDLKEDRQRSEKDLDRLRNRDTEFDKDIDKSVQKDKENAELLKKLQHLRRNLNLQRTNAGRINRPPGEPGSMTDKINELEDQLLNDKKVDKELLRKVQRVYTKASNGTIAGFHDLPKINTFGKDVADSIALTGEEIFSGSSKKALVLRGLMAIASGGATEMGMEITSSVFVVKDYVDKGGDSIVEGVILATGNTLINEVTGKATGKAAKTVTKKTSKIIKKASKNNETVKKIYDGIQDAKQARIKIRGTELQVGLDDKMIKKIIKNTAGTGNNMYIAPPFQDIFKSMFN